MSHEIRTPLNGILGMLQLLKASSLEQSQKGYLLDAIKSTNRLTRLLGDILDLSRIEAGKLAIRESEFSVANLRDSLAELFATAAREKGVGLEFNLHEGLPPALIGDENRLLQILFNLAGNALKFTEKGAVRVEAAPLTLAEASRIRVLFIVSDTGIGISDEQLKDIFEPFVQAEGSFARRYQGAGLGLSIVRKLVLMMGGELAIDNSPGGTAIYLSLPFALPKTRPGRIEPVAPVKPAAARNNLRVLFAEDDEVSLAAGKRMLEKFGHAVTAAVNGREALARLAEGDFDLILMDVQMPVMDGVATTRAIRDSETLGGKSRIPIIAMTAYAMTGDREKFLAVGMDDYIAKPVDMEALAAIIARVAGKAGKREPA